MPLHTGEAEERDGDYFGQTLNRVARLMAAGHGGQDLLSAATHALVCDQADITWRDFGDQRLKDLERCDHIFQNGQGDCMKALFGTQVGRNHIFGVKLRSDCASALNFGPKVGR